MILALHPGAGFGFALNKGGLTEYHKIAGDFRLTDLTAIKYILSAVVTAMIDLYALRSLGGIQLPAPPATYIAGNLIGDLIFGIGIALTGY